MSRDFPLILQLDIAGNPCRWMTYETAAHYKAKNQIAWTAGDSDFTIYGGNNRMTGTQSSMDLNTIIAVKGVMGDRGLFKVPILTNKSLFRRDQHICAYCGQFFQYEDLTCDHIQPVSKGGKDIWTNVVSACGGCNRYKDDRTPEQAGMKLLYAPYTPSKAEYLILMNRNILEDQMNFLKAKLPPHSRALPQPTQ